MIRRMAGANSWQADWVMETEAVVTIEFVDWGNPLENINPIVGLRFPVEVALYKQLETPMTAFKMACLEYPGSKDEVFGTSINPNPDPAAVSPTAPTLPRCSPTSSPPRSGIPTGPSPVSRSDRASARAAR